LDQSKTIDVGRRVIEIEAKALAKLSGSLNSSFAKAVLALQDAKGRIIVSGMGKSGHIARKIAATFASTGSPAHFVHPAEASHGDLGMMAAGDVVIVISNSGETPELAHLIEHTRRFSIPLIAICCREQSSLSRQADISILLPSAEEACETGVVPTTSTTMTLALGDALAVTLMKQKDFTPEHFRMYHPGGQLGAQLSLVSSLMRKDYPTVSLNTAMTDALLVMTRSGLGVVGVLSDDNSIAGIITDGDLRRHMDGLLGLQAKQVMTANPKTIHAGALAESAVALMNKHNITCLFVVAEKDSKDLVGVLNIHDCLRAGIV
jgi:arabinose-5-phosphate isomerase